MSMSLDDIQRLIRLIKAIKEGNVPEVEQVLENSPGTIVNTINPSMDPADRFPPLHYAVLYKDEEVGLEIVKILLNKGADPTYKDGNSQTIAFYLARDGRDRIAKLLLPNYPLNLNHVDGENQSAIYYAARDGHCGMIQILVDNGANPGLKDKYGQTCLFYAARDGRLEACKLLVKLGVEPFHQSKGKRNAMSFARQKNHKAIVDFFTSLKHDEKKTREIEKVKDTKDSSMNKEKKIVKKDAPKSDYIIVYTDQAGNVRELSQLELQEFKKQHEKLYNLIENPDLLQDEPSSTAAFQEKTRFLKIANKILGQCLKHRNGYLFQEPVNPILLGIPDYFNIVKRPMDFGTIKIKLQNNAYETYNNFVEDLFLVLDNSILYNGVEHFVGRAALDLKADVNVMIKEFYQV